MQRILAALAVAATTLPLAAYAQGTLPAGDYLGASRRPAVPTGPVPRLPSGQVDLDGAWIGGGAINDIELEGGMKPGEIPLLPWAKVLRDSRVESDEPHVWCLPTGVGRVTVFPFRFVQNYTHRLPTHLFMVFEGNIHSYRQIFMDGRKHPAELDPTWFGHSIGSWEGDTLVIDTVGYNDKFWFDRRGTPHTEQLHTIERFTRLDMGHMENKLTIDDPGAYSRTFTLTFPVTLSTADEILEYICQENNQAGWANGRKNPYVGR